MTKIYCRETLELYIQIVHLILGVHQDACGYSNVPTLNLSQALSQPQQLLTSSRHSGQWDRGHGAAIGRVAAVPWAWWVSGGVGAAGLVG